MANTKTVTSVQRVAVKQEDGTLGEEQRIGVTSDYVVDTNSSYTLDQIIKHYLSFIKKVPFIYDSDDGIEPTNTQHISIWIDRSETNQDNIVK